MPEGSLKKFTWTFEVPKCSKYHSSERLKCENVANTIQNRRQTLPNVAKCSKDHARCQVTRPKCSKYHAKRQVLVPNCCKVANIRQIVPGKKAKNIQNLSQKKYPKTILNPVPVYRYLVYNSVVLMYQHSIGLSESMQLLNRWDFHCRIVVGYVIEDRVLKCSCVLAVVCCLLKMHILVEALLRSFLTLQHESRSF